MGPRIMLITLNLLTSKQDCIISTSSASQAQKHEPSSL